MRDEFARAPATVEHESSPIGTVALSDIERWRDDERVALRAPWEFQGLLGSFQMARFVDRIWCARPLHVARESSHFYEKLLSLSDLEQYLSVREIFQRHSLTMPEQGVGFADPPPSSLSELYDRLLAGGALRVRNMETFLHPNEPLVALVNSIERALSQPCESISAYVSTGGARGLGPHHDETEIFTLQIAGEKRWRLYHRVASFEPGTHVVSDLSAPQADFVLKPGDLLYVPRGFIHEVTNDVASFSLTIVFRPIDWRSLPELLLAKVAALPDFCQPLPAFLGGDSEPRTWPQQFEQRVQLMRDALAQLTPRDLMNSAAERLLARATLPPVPELAAILSLEQISADTLLRKRPGILAHLTVQDGRATLLLPGGYRIAASARAEPALRQVLNGCAPFRVRDMHSSLSSTAKLQLARRLLSAGLLCLEQTWQQQVASYRVEAWEPKHE